MMVDRDSLCVFCGSRMGARPAYVEAARQVGTEAARRGWRIVYGGGNIGLMGEVADAALQAGGDVLGVIPRHLLEKEVGHVGLTDLRVVDSMHERKALMAAESTMFLALPGGLGTLEELAEIWTWRQLSLHNKPIGLLNTDRFYDPLLQFLDLATSEDFVKPVDRGRLVVGDRVPELLTRLHEERPFEPVESLEQT